MIASNSRWVRAILCDVDIQRRFEPRSHELARLLAIALAVVVIGIGVVYWGALDIAAVQRPVVPDYFIRFASNPVCRRL